ncbi:alpha/beta fold hydrolase [Streptomyces olivaceoviridis]|nr:alpha/beta fold hydrolase [Streptomyces corchorusii]
MHPSAHRRRPALGMSLLTATALLAVPALAVPAAGAPADTNAGSSSSRAAEPDTAALAGDLAKQTITWGTCEFPSVTSGEETLKRLLATPGLACATVKVPRDWHNPRDGHTIDLRVSKTATADPGAGYQGIALVNPGGPGGEGLPWGAAMAMRSPELAKHYDFIGFDPRGVGQSTHAPCKLPAEIPVLKTEEDLQRLFADSCRANELTKYITTEQTAYDMDFIRVLLGEDRTSYVGYSYGTWLGTWYAATFPSRVHRMLLDSSTDVAEKSLQRTWDLQAPSRDRAFQEQLLPYIARHDDVYGLGTDPLEVRRKWEEAGGSRGILAQIFTAWLILPAMYDTTKYADAALAVEYVVKAAEQMPKPSSPAEAETTVRAVFDDILDSGKVSDRAFVEEARSNALTVLPKITGTLADRVPTGTDASNGEFDATFDLIRCQDGQWNQDPAYWKAQQEKLDREAPFIAPLMKDSWLPMCAFVKTDNRMPKVDPRTFPKVMVLQDELDIATAYEGALDSARRLPGAKMISVDNEGSHGVFPYTTTCVDNPVFDYFLTGAMPQDKYTACQALPLPGEDEVYEAGGSVGKKGTIKIRMVTRDVRLANKLVRDLLRGQVIDPITGRPIPQ